VPDTIVVTTEHLESAVRLRGAFEEEGFRVELLTPGERLLDVPGEVRLLVLTGGLEERRARTLVAAARQLGRIPVVALREESGRPARQIRGDLGVAEVLEKPVDPDEVVLVGRRLVERERLRSVTGIIGETEEMEEVLERVVQIAPVDSTVLILGESGTGKELVARGIHALSRRRHRPFIAVNVAALPDTLLESELFGHEKGAFTGAASLRKGLFELANSGTIFLDEIGEMPLATQTKLLRVLEEREFRRVGGEELLRVDVRLVAATNQDLRTRVETGEFRRDLYHRLNVLRIELPPLRSRRADIPRLVDAFVRHFSEQHGRPFPGIEEEAMRILAEYDWPGNVRELRNLVESMVVLAPSTGIRAEHIPREVRDGRRGSLLPVLATPSALPREGGGPPPELEFVFRTLFDLRMDMDDLRREFESYRRRAGAPEERRLIPGRLLEIGLQEEEPPVEEEVGEVVFRPGMTMQEMEREAIGAALKRVRGNRRKAAEMLGIGERTLYRKIKEFGLGEE
jgi:DNA-binding NtrC family response regulator